MLDNATKAVSSLGVAVGDHLIAVENTPALHNMVVCTLCSCYPWDVLGLPPVWYKSLPYRSRVVMDPRGVLSDFGVTLPAETEIRIWDSTAETRFIVVPQRPGGNRRLERGATRNAHHSRLHDRHGPAPGARKGGEVNGVHDMGGMHGFGKVEPDADDHPFHASWEARVLAMQRAMRFTRAWNIDMSRDSIERQPPQRYLAASYYERWLMGMETSAVEKGLIDPDEIAAGHALRPAKPVAGVMTKADLGQSFTRGSFSRPTDHEARFKPGDRVRTKNINPATHTRLPRYARGHEGVIEAMRGCHVFPDSVMPPNPPLGEVI